MNINIAFPAFYGSWKSIYPELGVIDSMSDVDSSDLIIFSGGEDINANIYGEKNVYSHGINHYRDYVELRVLERAIARRKKILGVCRGHQLINAYLGANLIQDLYIQLEDHSSIHELSLQKDSYFVRHLPSTVNSLHHQGVYALGGSMRGLAKYKFVWEVTEYDSMIISVQFHPEWLSSCTIWLNDVRRWADPRTGEETKELQPVEVSRHIKKILKGGSPEDKAYDKYDNESSGMKMPISIRRARPIPRLQISDNPGDQEGDWSEEEQEEPSPETDHPDSVSGYNF